MKVDPIKKVKNVKVVITAKTWNDIQSIVKICKDEVSWFSEVTRKETKEDVYYYVDKVYIPDQEVHSTTTEMSPAGQAAIMSDVKDPNKLRCLGHSHVNMETGMSGQDDKQFQELYSNVDDHYISAIFNKKGAVSAWLCDYKLGYIFSDVKVYIGEQPSHKTYSEWDKIIKDKVKPLIPKHSKTGSVARYYGSTVWDDVCDMCGAYATEAELHHKDMHGNVCQECYFELKDSGQTIKKEDVVDLGEEDIAICDNCQADEDEIEGIMIHYPPGNDFDCLCEDCAKNLALANKIKENAYVRLQ